jgi:hypothetical protein
MNDLNSEEKTTGGCCSQAAPTSCCQPSDRSASTCCNTEDTSWRRGKLIISAIIIMAAIAVGANSFLNGNTAQSYTTIPAKSFSAGLTEIPATAVDNSNEGNPKTKSEEISLNLVLDSLQALDTLAADKDVVFLVLPGEAQIPTVAIPKPLEAVANNLWKNGQRVAVFTLKSSSSDHNRLVRHFSVKTFPSIVILGRQGSASAVTEDVSEARLYNAFVLASKSASCCPTAGNSSCCPK